MATTLGGFPFWLLTFDKDGRPSEPAAVDAFVRETGEKKLADLFVFSHGWNNDPAMAMSLYSAFFAEVRKLVDDATIPKHRAASIGTAGVIWPSINEDLLGHSTSQKSPMRSMGVISERLSTFQRSNGKFAPW